MAPRLTAPRPMKTPADPGPAPAVLMIRPAAFGFAPDAAATNTFQRDPGLPRGDSSAHVQQAQAQLARAARREVEGAAAALASAGVTVRLIDDLPPGPDPARPGHVRPACPDSVFPNNWIGLHPEGRAILYPMAVPSRRAERRPDVLDLVRDLHRTRSVTDLSALEASGHFVEGTGSLVLDHRSRRAFAALSPRTTLPGVRAACAALGFTPVFFSAVLDGRPVYHTNVLMSVGPGVAVLAAEGLIAGRRSGEVESGSYCVAGEVESGSDREERASVRGVSGSEHSSNQSGGGFEPGSTHGSVAHLLSDAGRVDLIRLEEEQVRGFAGNVIWLRAGGRRGQQDQDREDQDRIVCLMSRRAEAAFTRAQLSRLGRRCVVDIPVIEEVGGGSARCMVAEIFSAEIFNRESE